MNSLTIEKLFGLTNLSLKVGQATFRIINGSLMVEVIFPKVYPLPGHDSDVTDPSANMPEDFWLKESDSKLELELPLPIGVGDVIENEFFIDSQDEDNEDLTNFYIAHTHYPTFDDRICIHKTDTDGYLLRWTGLMPDIKTSKYEMYMQLMYKFTLETPIIYLK